MTQHIIEVRNLEFSYMDGTKAIKDLTVSLPRGKKIAIVGNNGAGKTTFFLHFNGVHRPQKGFVLYNGEKINYSGKELKKLRKNVGIVFQDPDNQLFSASVFQDVSFGPLNLGWNQETVRQKVVEVMIKTGIWDLKDKPTHFLSQGQKKRVAIAGVLAMEPEVIVLDEPTAGLDPLYTGQIMQLLNEFNEMGKTIILSSHNMDEVYAWSDYVLVMNNGEIISEGDPVNIFRDDNVLGKANLTKPWVLEVYDKLFELHNIIEVKNPPKTKQELFKLIHTN